MTYRKSLNFSGRGSAPELFRSTLDAIAVDPGERVYAAGDSSVKVFDAGGKLLRNWPTAKRGFGVGISPDGTVWVGEAGQVEVFNAQGQLAFTWQDSELLGRISAIGFWKNSVLLGDAKHRCIRRYDAGKHAATIGANNNTSGLLIPNGVVSFSVARDGIVHTANPGKHRIERYTVSGQLLGHIGRFDGVDPAGFQGCCNPTNVAVGGDGHIYVTEKADPRAKVYDLDGKLLGVIGSDVFDRGCRNMSIAVDRNHRVYVADTVRLEILAFAPVA